MKRSELKQIIREVIEESLLYEEMSKASDVRDLILANPSMTAKEAAAKLGVSLNDASSAISRLRKAGKLPAKNAGTTKAPEKAKKTPAKKTKVPEPGLKELNEILSKHKLKVYNDELDEYSETVGFSVDTKDSGQRLDMGGGEDGDDWLDSNQKARVINPYKQKWRPIIEAIEKSMKDKGFKDPRVEFEYTDKGKVWLLGYYDK
jgi:hypothetical protein